MPYANAFSGAVMAALGVAGVLSTSVAWANHPQSTLGHEAPVASLPDPRASYYPRLLYPSTTVPSTLTPKPATRPEGTATQGGLTLPAYKPPPMSRLYLRAHH